MKERRRHKRISVKDGVFAVIKGTPYKIVDIGLGGASFQCDEDFISDKKYNMEILIMNGNIHYIHNVRHSLVNVFTGSHDMIDVKSPKRVSVSFGELTTHQSAQFQMLLGIY